MFDGEETKAAVLLITDGDEIYAVPVHRVDDKLWENKLTKACRMRFSATVIQALGIPGAAVEVPHGKG